MISFATQFQPAIPVTLQGDSSALGNRSPLLLPVVGAVLPSAISLRELQAHAAHCHLLMQLAKARCRPEIHSAQDEEDLRTWSRAKEEAQAAVLAARRVLHDPDHLSFHGEWTCEIDGTRAVRGDR